MEPRRVNELIVRACQLKLAPARLSDVVRNEEHFRTKVDDGTYDGLLK